ncbi:TPA: ATP-binding protein [Burkholderia vietnamiensis]|nr:ATP-binding protein [Burkholderia vietnamiensis]
MKYKESKIDKELRQWFVNDFSKVLLREIEITKGALRGIGSLHVEFNYPITAFAGVNGAGKSTILAIACCAFHGDKTTYKLPRRRYPYYTFSDFFIQHKEEKTPDGIVIWYLIAHNGWVPSERVPDGKGLGYQTRRKNKGGKWNDYDSRVNRTVVFLGIERIVPHSERSQSRSYSKAFASVKPKGWEKKVRDAVGYILGKKYDDFRYLEHSRYSLPIVKVGAITYSGFNMGAGENALFEIFSTIYSAGEGTLLVMDEIELGLHAKAQRLFMAKLKEICLEMKTQVICTTHSKEIFECLPDDARFYVETVSDKTKLIAGISPDFAFAKMGAPGGNELDIFVEDEVAQSLLQAILPAAIRTRVTIKVIGSATSIARQLAALYVRKDEKPTLAVFDGDQRALEKENFKHVKSMAEKTDAEFQKWFADRVAYLPGETWPEAWIIQKATEVSDAAAAALSVEPEEVKGILEYGLQAGKHSEFYEISKNVALSKQQCLDRLSATVCAKFNGDFDGLVDVLRNKLN